jgi:putative transposase
MLYSRFIGWSCIGVFSKIFVCTTVKAGKADQLMINAAHLKALRVAASALK